MLSASAITSSTFAHFIDGLPYCSGTTIVLDNASIHKTSVVRSIAHKKGYELLFLPPYTPEFNAIELMFGVVKNAYYADRYVSSDAKIDDAVHRSLQKVTKSSIIGCFRHVQTVMGHKPLIQCDAAGAQCPHDERTADWFAHKGRAC
jgi:transposase